ncbi:MAG: hypothetical protein ACTSRK_15045 [Promethearchaeota archaeon]
MLLQEGEIYSSPLDLNKEYGAIEIPFLPVLRIGLPLFNPEGNRKGILIININFRYILEFIKSHLQENEIYFADIDGFFFTNPIEPENVWGQPVNLNESSWNIENEYPSLFTTIQNSDLEMEKPSKFVDESSSKRTIFIYKILNMQVGGSGLYWILFGAGDYQHFFSLNGNSLLNEYILIVGIWALTSVMFLLLLKRINQAYRRQIAAEKEVKKLRDILPMCANCKKIRDGEGKWHSVDEYLHDNTESKISHGICPSCASELYGDLLD